MTFFSKKIISWLLLVVEDNKNYIVEKKLKNGKGSFEWKKFGEKLFKPLIYIFIECEI